MAKLTHQSNFNSVAFGQFGSTHLDSAGNDLTCPAGKVFVAVTMLEDTKFTKLEAVDNGATSGSFGTDGANNDFDGKGDQVAATTVFPKGLTIYGEWDTININTSGKIIAYWGPAN